MILASLFSLAYAGISGIYLVDQPGEVTKLICEGNDGLIRSINDPAATLDDPGRPELIGQIRTTLLWGRYVERCKRIRAITVVVPEGERVSWTLANVIAEKYGELGYDVAELDALAEERMRPYRPGAPLSTDDYERAFREVLGDEQYERALDAVFPVVERSSVRMRLIKSRRGVRITAEAWDVLGSYDVGRPHDWGQPMGYSGVLFAGDKPVMSGHI